MDNKIGHSVTNYEFSTDNKKNHEKLMFLFGSILGEGIKIDTEFVNDLTNCMTSKFELKQSKSI